ncbi:hypothetical protein [Cryobacterium breve]|uniref:hypothetical protein n=1 Tax=Cryobacterium breve TaxID=1259258 RepID=UPI00106D088C|nr:hypothetical protein [Cryobacterium breve]TFC96807.1 hypothetical protein E3T20_02055 [Cryobacterium sp. TmT3-12]
METRVWAVTALCGLALFMALPPAVAIYAVRDPSYSCVVDELPALRESVDPGEPIVGRITLIPLGLECEFTSMTGKAMTVKPDLVLTAMLATSAAFVLAAGLVLVQGSSRRRVLLDAERHRESLSETV